MSSRQAVTAVRETVHTEVHMRILGENFGSHSFRPKLVTLMLTSTMNPCRNRLATWELNTSLRYATRAIEASLARHLHSLPACRTWALEFMPYLLYG